MQPLEVNDDELDVEQDHELNASDRCDACGAQAYIRVTLSTGQLYFCAHHGNENKPKLESIVLDWHDETEKLLAR